MDMKSLRITDPYFQYIIDTLPILLFWTDKNHIILGNNKLHATSFGFSSVKDIVGIPMEEALKTVNFDKNQIEKLYEEHNEIVNSKIGRIFEYTFDLFDTTLNRKKTTYLLSHKQPLLDENNHVIGIVGISMDITELRVTQNELIKTKLSTDKIFQNIIDALPVLLFWTDKKNIYLGNNARHAIAFGFDSAKEVIGRTLYDTFLNVDFDSSITDRICKEHKEIMRIGKGQILEYTVSLFDSNHNKRQATYLSQKYPLFDENGEVIGVTGISMDITELKDTQEALTKAKEKAEASSAAKSEFIANMSHDLRTPMMGVIGMLQALLYTMEDAERKIQENPVCSPEKYENIFQDLFSRIREYTMIAQLSSQELIELLNEILETARLESGHQQIKQESFDLSVLIQKAMNLLQSIAVHKQLYFSVHIDHRIPRYLKGSQLYLHRSLLNLISNALKFTDHGSVAINVGIKDPADKYKKGDQISLIISIRDTGIGIPEDKFNQIFEHFSRLTSSYQGIYKGSGLGLYSVKQYVDAMDGKVSVESEVGKGSCFTLTIPFLVEDHADPVMDEASKKTLIQPASLPVSQGIDQGKTTNAQKASILLVEDSAAAAMVVRMFLEQWNCQVDIAQTGADAVNKASTEIYDLVFMDVGLPDFDGIEVTRRIRHLSDHQKSQVPIIALTGHADSEEKCVDCLNAGMQEVLSKPVQPLTLQNVLKKWIWQVEILVAH